MRHMLGVRGDTILGLVGLVIIGGNVGTTLWRNIQAAPSITTRVCAANHYNIHQGCARGDHTLSAPQAGQAYVVTNAAGAAGGVSDYRIVQDNPDGTTIDINTWSTDVSNAPHYVVSLATLWGEKIQAGTYEVVTDTSTGHSRHYYLTISQPPPKPTHTATPTPTTTLTPTVTPTLTFTSTPTPTATLTPTAART